MLTILIEHKGCSVELRILFPTMYPNGAHPNFTVITTTLSPMERSQYIQNINNIAKNTVQKNLVCVELIVIHTFEFLELQQSNVVIEHESDELPCPRLAGACFTNDGKLLYFRNFSFTQSKQTLPHSYDGLKNFIDRPVNNQEQNDQTQSNDLHSVSSYYYTEDFSDLSIKRTNSGLKVSTKNKNQSRSAFSQQVILVDVSNLTVIDKNLSSYQITGDNASEVCKNNALIARANHREDLYKSWLLLSTISQQNLYMPSSNSNPKLSSANSHKSNRIAIRRYASAGGRNQQYQYQSQSFMNEPAWILHPFAKQLVESIFLHYRKIRDVQTLAVMSCVLSLPPNPLQQFVSYLHFIFKVFNLLL